jgi:hypothetical protein
MGFQKPKSARPHEPSGFTPRSSGRASERARQQGWQTNEEERTREPEGKQQSDGGTDYNYGAQDFGDLPAGTSSAQPPAQTSKSETTKRRKKAA